MNFRYRLMQFMSGRYGVDNLFYVLFGGAMVLSVINIFARSVILQFIVYAIIIFAFFRFLSRNISARARENQYVNGFINKIIAARNVRRQRRADFTHIYKKCPYCHAILRLPRKKGKHTTVCPKCSKSFKVRVFKG